MGELSAWHWLVVVVVAVVLFGSRRLPDAARSIGRSARILKAELREGAATPPNDPPVTARETPPREAAPPLRETPPLREVPPVRESQPAELRDAAPAPAAAPSEPPAPEPRA